LPDRLSRHSSLPDGKGSRSDGQKKRERFFAKEAQIDRKKAGFNPGTRPTSKFVILNEVKDLKPTSNRKILRKRGSE
jgi:hypothetical protein